MRALFAAAALAVLVGFFSCRELPTREMVLLASYPTGLEDAPEVRIALATGRDELEVELLADATAADEAGRPIRGGGVLRLGRSGEMVAYKSADGRACEAKLLHVEGKVLFEGRSFRGRLELSPSSGKGLDAVAGLKIEEYLCGVLAGELPRGFHEETCKAQAVCARTYALYHSRIARVKGRKWDMTAGTSSQVYRSAASFSAKINIAVNSTRGLVMTWDERLFSAFYSSSCGGHTDDASLVFGTDPITPLSGVNCPYCSKAGHKWKEWEIRVFHDDAARKLLPFARDKGVVLGEVSALRPVFCERTRRARSIMVDHAFGKLEVPSHAFRTRLGTSVLRSTLITSFTGGQDSTAFKGRGWGHGVGMCQWGAEVMAREGKDYSDILRHYYPGRRLKRVEYAR